MERPRRHAEENPPLGDVPDLLPAWQTCDGNNTYRETVLAASAGRTCRVECWVEGASQTCCWWARALALTRLAARAEGEMVWPQAQTITPQGHCALTMASTAKVREMIQVLSSVSRVSSNMSLWEATRASSASTRAVKLAMPPWCVRLRRSVGQCAQAGSEGSGHPPQLLREYETLRGGICNVGC